MTALYYLTPNPDNELCKAKIKVSDNEFSFEPAQSIFIGSHNRFDYWDDPEIHPNGDRYLTHQMESASERAVEPRIKVIVNWEKELEKN